MMHVTLWNYLVYYSRKIAVNLDYGGQTMEASCTTEFVEPVVTIGFVQKSMVLCFFRRKISRNCTSQFSSFPKVLIRCVPLFFFHFWFRIQK